MQYGFFLAVLAKQHFVSAHERTLGHALLPAEPVHVRLRGRKRRGRRIIRIQHRAIGFALILEDARFGTAIRLQRVMAVQMVGCEIQEHADVGAERFNQLQLKTAQLRDCDGVVAGLLHACDQGRADISRENGGKAGVLQNVFD